MGAWNAGQRAGGLEDGFLDSLNPEPETPKP